MKKRSNMKLDNTANEIIDWFTRGIYPAPYTFTDQQIESMSNINRTCARRLHRGPTVLSGVGSGLA